MARVQRYYRNKTLWDATGSFFDILGVSVLREFRSTSGGAVMSVVKSFMQPLLLFFGFFILYEVFGRGMIIRGDFVLFMITGIMLFLLHIRAVKKLQTESGAQQSGMIFYAKASMLLNILASALHELYLNTIAMVIILTFAYLIRGHLEIYEPGRMIAPLFFAWASGLAVGMLFSAVAPLFPVVSGSFYQFYRRAQMFTSGKMFLANLVPASILPFFDWNPLFHTIDQARGAAFINYLPRNTNMSYPIYFTIAVITIALIVMYALRASKDRGIE
jgi:ABC-type polysaccharide/polyol phosphate export permease